MQVVSRAARTLMAADMKAVVSAAHLDAAGAGEDQLYVFHQYLQAINFALQNGNPGTALELGSGRSTAAVALLAERTGAHFISVDADAESVRRRLWNSRLWRALKRRVDFRVGSSMSLASIGEYYDDRAKADLGGVSAAAVCQEVERFVQPCDDGYPTSREAASSREALVDFVRQHFFDSDGIRLPGDLIGRPILDAQLRWAAHATGSETGVLEEIHREFGDFGFVFFDSSEYASAVEWAFLKRRITVGGLAAFHDIYYPKSIKNFMVCASIVADPDWNVLYVDRSTPQGMMVAQRIG